MSNNNNRRNSNNRNVPARQNDNKNGGNAIQKMMTGLNRTVSDLANEAVSKREVLDVQIKKGRSGFVMKHTPGNCGG